MASQIDQIREAAEADLVTFVRLVAPYLCLGPIHIEALRWLANRDSGQHKLLLLPRDHLKSRMVAFYVAWRITQNPAATFLYLSSTTTLAEKQLKTIKDILTSRIYRRYWPEMVNENEDSREKWTASEISVDHPRRKEEAVRDSTVFTAGLTTSVTGLHCSEAILDDIVVYENAYTKEGRETVKHQYSLLASIESADARETAVGTRYHPSDLYGDMIEMTEDTYDADGNIIESKPVYEVFQREVEDAGDGSGEYLWPRTQRKDGKWFGFNKQILARKRAQYLDKSQFRAQYYNDVNFEEEGGIARNLFQYYDRTKLSYRNGGWYFGDSRLTTAAAMDFAYSLKPSSDFTCIAVVGVDDKGNYFVLDLVRFKTNKVSEYYEEIAKAHDKWKFRRMRCETTAAQSIIVEELKKTYIARDGRLLTIDAFTPTRNMGSKEERIDAILRPRYETQNVWHYKSAVTEELENELVQPKPKHDDAKDALATAIDLAGKSVITRYDHGVRGERKPRIRYNGKFGGVG